VNGEFSIPPCIPAPSIPGLAPEHFFPASADARSSVGGGQDIVTLGSTWLSAEPQHPSLPG